MSNDNKLVRISQLPETTKINSGDYLVIENTEDTWKVAFSIINEYIQSIVKDRIDKDMSGTVDQKIGEIQLQVSQVNELITQLNKDKDAFKNAEEIRVRQENERIQNETARQKTYEDNNQLVNQWIEDENYRKDIFTGLLGDWDDMSDTFVDWTNAETARVAEENKRKQAEQNRATAETARQNQATAFANQESERVQNENNRKASFNNMTSYFDNVKSYVDGRVLEGTTYLPSANKVAGMLMIKLPLQNHGYEALIHLTQGDIHIFFSLDIQFTYNDSGDIIDSRATILVPAVLSDYINVETELFVGYKVSNARVILLVQYKGRSAGLVRTAIMWDNISTYKPNAYTTVNAYAFTKESSNATNFSTSYTKLPTITTATSVNNLPQGFIKMFNTIETQISDMIRAIKPYKMYPVGTIYMTTSNTNPSKLLGGGSWKALYGGKAISEGYQSKSGTTYDSPGIYYWTRIE